MARSDNKQQARGRGDRLGTAPHQGQDQAGGGDRENQRGRGQAQGSGPGGCDSVSAGRAGCDRQGNQTAGAKKHHTYLDTVTGQMKTVKSGAVAKAHFRAGQIAKDRAIDRRTAIWEIKWKDLLLRHLRRARGG
jgi:hypothetical protein